MMAEQIGPAHDSAHEAERTEHQAMMARIEILDQANRLEHEANRLEHEANRAEHQAMMARIEALDQANRQEHVANRQEHEANRQEHVANRQEHEANRQEHATNRAEHAAMMTRIEALDQANRQEHEANRGEHKAIMTQLSRLGRELAKLGVEFEQHRNDTKVYADGILGLVQKNEALERFDAALDCRVTKLEVRVSSLAPRTRGTE